MGTRRGGSRRGARGVQGWGGRAPAGGGLAWPCVRPFVTSHTPAVQPLRAQARGPRGVVCLVGAAPCHPERGSRASARSRPRRSVPTGARLACCGYGREAPRGEPSGEEGRPAATTHVTFPEQMLLFIPLQPGVTGSCSLWPREGEGWPKDTQHPQPGSECTVGLWRSSPRLGPNVAPILVLGAGRNSSCPTFSHRGRTGQVVIAPSAGAITQPICTGPSQERRGGAGSGVGEAPRLG